MDKKPRVYVSHSIRGKLGDKATSESMAANNELAHNAVALMRQVMPELEFYVPGEHDEVISLLFHAGKLADQDILWADCELIKRTCVILIVYTPDGFISAGMNTEIDHAFVHHIPVFTIQSIDELQRTKGLIRECLQTIKLAQAEDNE